jgi:hypothetical protein
MGFFSGLFARKSYECSVEADKWTKRASAADRVGKHRLAAQCRTNAASFHRAGDGWRQSGREAHLAHLEATDQSDSPGVRPTRVTRLGPRRR